MRQPLLWGLALLWTCTGLQAQPVQAPDWQASQAGINGISMTLDPTGSPYTLGVATPNVFDASVGTVVLSRYTPAGALQWTRTWFPTNYTGARAAKVLTDAAGNAFVIGGYSDYNFVIVTLADGTTTTQPIGLFDGGWLALKYGPDGTLLWARKAPRSGGAAVTGAVDAAGDLYLLAGASGNRAFYTEKVSGSTGATLWTANSQAVLNGEVPGDLKLTANGQVVVAGAGGLGITLNAHAASTGALQWTTRLPEAAGLYAPALAVGPLGELVVTGSAGSASLYLASIDTNRLVTFAKTFPQASRGLRVAVDGLGRIVVAGIGAQPSNWVTLVTDAAGQLLAAPSVLDRHATASEAPTALALLGGGGFTVTGAAGPGPSTSPLTTSATTLRMNIDGSTAWLASAAAVRSGVAVQPAADGSVYVMGNTNQTLLHYPAVALPTPVALTLARTTLTGGRSTSGSLRLSSTAGAVVTLTSSHPALVAVPASVTVAAGASSAVFTATTSRTRQTTAVTITARTNGQSISTVLTVAR